MIGTRVGATIEMVEEGAKETSTSLVWLRSSGSAVVFGTTINCSELHVVEDMRHAAA